MDMATSIGRSCAWILVGASLAAGCSSEGSAESTPPTGESELTKSTAPLPAGHWVLERGIDEEFLVAWPVDVTIAPDGSFTGEFNRTLFEPEGMNSEIGTSGPVKGKVTFTPSADAAHKPSEGVVSFKYTYENNGKNTESFKYRVASGRRVEMMLRGAKIDAEWRQVRYMIFELPGASGSFSERATQMRVVTEQAQLAWRRSLAEYPDGPHASEIKTSLGGQS